MSVAQNDKLTAVVREITVRTQPDGDQWCCFAESRIDFLKPEGGYITGLEIKSPGLWGIDVEPDGDYLTEVGDEELAELGRMLAALGLDKAETSMHRTHITRHGARLQDDEGAISLPRSVVLPHPAYVITLDTPGQGMRAGDDALVTDQMEVPSTISALVGKVLDGAAARSVAASMTHALGAGARSVSVRLDTGFFITAHVA